MTEPHHHHHDDLLLERLTFTPGAQTLTPIPWPEGLAPAPGQIVGSPDASMPRADVLVVTWTAAEAEALADVLTPGHHRTTWLPYAKNWASFKDHLTGRSPAHEAGCLAHYWVTRIGSTSVVVAKSELHLATDDETAPIVALWQQMIADVQPKLVITTGTAGGIGANTVLGDVFIVGNAKFNCTKHFKSKPWAQARYSSPEMVGIGASLQVANETLIPANAGRLGPSGIASRVPLIWTGGDVETVDYFAFADTDDSYGVIKNDPQAHTEEMDDATLPLALYEMKSSIPWLSIRNASDPQVPSSLGDLEAQKKWAASIYNRFGYWTTVGSAIACWAVIADLPTTTQPEGAAA